MTDKWIKFDCIEVAQPIGTFYLGVIDSKDVVEISYADVRRPEGRDLERYIGTQRDLSEGRVAEISQYVTTVDACFPTSVILAIKREDAKFDEAHKKLSVRRGRDVAKIIDGQHRIAGLMGFKGVPGFKLNVTIFVDMDIEDQAMVFATINLKQTKVTKSLAYDLFEYTSSRSPQKTCHNVAKLVNSREGSPFYGRIKILGKAEGDGMQVITQATFVDRLMKLITRDAMDDRDRLARKRSLDRAAGKRGESLIFRDYFIDGKDAEIAKIIWNYFDAVEERWPKGWNNSSKGMILAKTTGFAALLRLLPEIWNDMQMVSGIPSSQRFKEYLDRVRIKDSEFTSSNYKPGSTGEGELLSDFREHIFEED